MVVLFFSFIYEHFPGLIAFINRPATWEGKSRWINSVIFHRKKITEEKVSGHMRDFRCDFSSHGISCDEQTTYDWSTKKSPRKSAVIFLTGYARLFLSFKSLYWFGTAEH